MPFLIQFLTVLKVYKRKIILKKYKTILIEIRIKCFQIVAQCQLYRNQKSGQGRAVLVLSMDTEYKKYKILDMLIIFQGIFKTMIKTLQQVKRLLKDHRVGYL